jgi:hypothetical protein
MRTTANLHVGLVLGIATASVILALGGCVTGGTGQAQGSAAPTAGSPSAAALEPFSESERERILAVQSIVAQAAAEHGLDAELINAVIWVESRFDPEAKSPAGARGLMQLMPATAAYLAKQMGERSPRAYDPEFNVRAGALYLAEMMSKFGEERYAVAAYHAGPGNVKKWLESGEAFPDYSDTYVAKVMDARSRFEGDDERGSTGARRSGALAAEPKTTPKSERKSAPKPESEPEPLEVPDVSTLPDAAEIHGVERVVYVNHRTEREREREVVPRPTPAPVVQEHDEQPVFVVHRELDANPGAGTTWRISAPEPQARPRQQPRPRREPEPKPKPEPKPESQPEPKPKPEPKPEPQPEPSAEEAGLGVLPDL